MGGCKGWALSPCSSTSSRSSSPYHTQDTAQGCHSGHTQGRRMVRLQQRDLVLSLTKVCSMIFKCQINCCQIWKRWVSFWKLISGNESQGCFRQYSLTRVDPQHLCGHNLTCNVMVGAPGWHFEFVPAARPRGSVTLLPAGIQGNTLAIDSGKGRGIRRVIRDTQSQRECSLVTLQSNWKKKFLCVLSTAEISCAAVPCLSTPCPDVQTWWSAFMGEGHSRTYIFNYKLGGGGWLVLVCLLCLLWSNIFLVLFHFLNLGSDGWNRERKERSENNGKSKKQWHPTPPKKNLLKNKTCFSSSVLLEHLGYTYSIFFKISNILTVIRT